jgi:hypothetical protein
MVTTLLIFLAWVATGPRSLPFLAKYLEQEISAILPETTNLLLDDVRIGLTKGRIAFLLHKARFKDDKWGEFLFPEMQIGLDVLGLIPFSQHNLFNLQISAPQLNLNRLASKEGRNFIEPLRQYIAKHEQDLLKFSFSLANSAFEIPLNDKQNVPVGIKQITIKPIKLNKKLVVTVSGELEFAKRSNMLHALLFIADNQLNIEGSLNNIALDTFAELGLSPALFEGSNLTTAVSFKTSVNDGNSSLGKIEFFFHDFDGEIKANKYFSRPIAPKSLELKGRCQNFCREIWIDKFAFNILDLNLLANFYFVTSDKKRLLTGDIHLKNLPVAALGLYWPESVSTVSRQWVLANIQGGKISNAHAILNFDLDNLVSGKALHKDALVVNLDLEDSSVTYMPTVPKIHNVNGRVIIKNDNISFRVNDALIKDTKINFAEGLLNDLTKDYTRLFVTAQLTGPVQDLADLGFAHAEITKHQYQKLSGNAASKLTLNIPINDKPLNLEDISLLFESTITQFAGENLYENYNLTKGELKAYYKDAAIKITGKAILNNSVPVDISFHQDLKQSEKNISLNAYLNWQEVTKLGFKKPDFVNNFVGLRYLIKEDKGGLSKMINLDLTNSTVYLKSLGIMKKIGDPGMLKLLLEGSDLKANISDFYIKIGNFESRGQGSASHDFSNIYSLSSEDTHLGKSNFGFRLKKTHDTTDFIIEGDSLDLSFVNLMESANMGENATDNLKFVAHVNKIFLRDDITLNKPKLSVQCQAKKCSTINLQGNAGSDKTMEINLTYPDLAVKTNDAGMFIKALGVSQKIDAGSLAIDGKYQGDLLAGTLKMDNFKLTRAPMLAKILSLASLTVAIFDSLGNIMGGEGIKFDKATCPFTYDGAVVKLNKCEAVGSSLMLSGEGIIDLKKNMVKIHGTIAVNSIIDSTLGKIPLVGRLITGQDEKGFIGTNFSIDGPLDDAQASANPLSLLTPGILRQIFSINRKPSE